MKLAEINAILFQQPDISKQTLSGLKTLFPGRDVSMILKIHDFETSTYFSAASISLLIKACLENFVAADLQEAVNISGLGFDLFKTILIFNENHFRSDPSMKYDSFEGIFQLDLQQQAYIRSNVYQKMFTLVKFAFAAKYISSASDFKQECRQFCTYYNIGNPWAFGRFFMDILQAILPENEEGKYTLETTGMPASIINEFSIDKIKLAGHKKLSINMDIVPKPFYLIGTNAIILDYNFFHYAIDQGFFFLFFLRTSLTDKKRFNTYNAYQGHIGYHFFEQFLVKEYLSKIFFRNYQKIVSSKQYGDFIVKTSENNVLVIEVKNCTVHGKILEQMDFQAFCAVIEQNFLTSKQPGVKGKGLWQIATQIGNLTCEDSYLRRNLHIENVRKVSVYPIIIYGDPNFDISGVNCHVNEHFGSFIDESEKLLKSVKPVTLVNVNSLIKYFAFLKEKPNRLCNLIEEYHAYVAKNKKRYRKNGHPHEHYLYNRSFVSYLEGKLIADHFANNLSAMKKDFDLNIGAPE